jgi:flagellar protein FliO/FliZ
MTGFVLLARPRLRCPLLTGSMSSLLLLAASPARAATRYTNGTLLPAAVRHAGHSSAVGAVVSGTGDAAVHMLLGLAIVCALIFALYKILRRTAGKNDRKVRDDGWMQVVSSTPLAPSRSLHLVRVGEEVVLLGSSEQSLTTIRVYSPQEARALGVDATSIEASKPVGPDGGSAFGSSLIETLKRMTAR